MYRIKITQETTVKKKCGKSWQVIDQKMDDGSGQFKDVYGYTPEIEKEIETERELLSQEVEELDLAAVIRAVNKL